MSRTTSIYYAFQPSHLWSAGLCAEPDSRLQVCFGSAPHIFFSFGLNRLSRRTHLMVTIEAQEDGPNYTSTFQVFICILSTNILPAKPVTQPNRTSLEQYSPHLVRRKRTWIQGRVKIWEQFCNLPYRLSFDSALCSNATGYQVFPSQAYSVFIDFLSQ